MDIAEIRECLKSSAMFDAIGCPKKKAFLVAYAICGKIVTAAQQATVVPQTVWNWKQNDDRFLEMMGFAHQIYGECLEAEAERRATDGVVQYKFYEGKPIAHPDPEMVDKDGERLPYSELKYSDGLLMFLLKGVFPEKYKERWQLDGVPKPDNDIARARAVLDDAGADVETLAALNLLAKRVAQSEAPKRLEGGNGKGHDNGNGNGKA